MPLDLDAIVNRGILKVFANVAVVTPADGGDSYPVEMVRHTNRAQADIGGEVVQVEGEVHTIFARLSGFPPGRTLQQGDRVAIGDKVFTVAGIPAPDETGWLAVNVYAGEVAADV